MRAKNVAKNFLIISGIMFWFFIILSFVPLPKSFITLLFNIMSIFWWIVVFPLELSFLILITCVFSLSVLLEYCSSKRTENRTNSSIKRTNVKYL